MRRGIAAIVVAAAALAAVVAALAPRPDRPERLWGRAEESVFGGLTDCTEFALEPGGETREFFDWFGAGTYESVSHGHLTMRLRRRPDPGPLAQILESVGLSELAEDGDWYCRTDRVVVADGSSWVEFEVRDRD